MVVQFGTELTFETKFYINYRTEISRWTVDSDRQAVVGYFVNP
jgi:hypothetical protein